ncbi:Uncharacterized protein FWK35_00003210 [Aphis craccivora]|uniref:Uncharacterized protein n=1 Tax=Aphis craccivora TaxID=307492 RepID=A0A6G0Z4A5_APHCR|nr:Uncharacterized protein FWK35_00003210 [Aphis craccivora]
MSYKQGYNRTNNISEGWNNNFTKYDELMNSITTMEILKLNTVLLIELKFWCIQTIKNKPPFSPTIRNDILG